MTIGFCKDYIDEYVKANDPKQKNKARKASQADYDAF
jgi:hypothetical protein